MPPAAGVRTTAGTSADGATAAPVDGQTPEGQASLSDGGLVSIPRATFESMKAQLDGLVKAEQDRQTEAMLSDAMQAGKISPAEVAAWRANLAKPEARAGAAAMLSELPARYPVTMLGAGTTTTSFAGGAGRCSRCTPAPSRCRAARSIPAALSSRRMR